MSYTPEHRCIPVHPCFIPPPSPPPPPPRSHHLLHRMGWDVPIGGSVLAAQLLELGKMRVEGEGPSLGPALAAAVPLMYTRLSEMMGGEEMEVVKAVLEVRAES